MTHGPAMLRQLQRGAAAKQALAEEFGLLSSAEVAERAGSAAANVAALASRWRTRGEIFAVDVEGSVRFPGFQLDADGRPLPIVAEVVRALSPVYSGWELALWFIAANSRLDGSRPVDLLRGASSDTQAVVQAARAVALELGG